MSADGPAGARRARVCARNGARRRGRLAVIALAVGTLALSGCSSPAGGGPGATAEPSPSATPTPTPLTPEQQAEADLAQLVRDYYAQMNALYADPTMSLDELTRYTNGQLLQLRLLLHSQFRTEGNRAVGGRRNPSTQTSKSSHSTFRPHHQTP